MFRSLQKVGSANPLLSPKILCSVLIILLLIALYLPVGLIDTPMILADEIGYLNNAGALSGLHFEGANKYAPGYSFLLVPLFSWFSDVITVYNGVQVLNKLLILSCLFLLTDILRAIFHISKAHSVIYSAVALLYPSILVYSNLAIPESLIALQAILLIYLLSASRFDNVKGLFIFQFLAGITISWMAHTHPRAYPILLVYFLIFLATYFLKYKSRKSLSLIFMGSLIISHLLFSRLQEQIDYNFTGDLAASYGIIKNKVSFISRFFTWKTTKTIIGQSTYLIYASAGLLIPFIRISAESLTSCFNDRTFSLDRIIILCSASMLVASILLSSTFMSSNVRGDMVIYGRYNEVFMTLVLIIGLMYKRKSDFKYLCYSCIITGLFAFLCSFNNLEFINTINVTSFWSHISFDVHELALWCLFTISFGKLIFSIQNKAISAFIVGLYFFLQFLLFNSSWFQRYYPIYESREIFDTIDKSDTVAFDCEDIYNLSEDGCKQDYIGCYKWLYSKYSYLFSYQEIRKLYFEQWISSDRNIFFSSTYRSDYKHLIRGSENTISGRHYVYAKLWSQKQNNCFLPDCYQWQPSDKTTFTGVGKIENKQLVSSNTAGALLYGPYTLLPAGKYHYILFGKITSKGSPFFDITYDDASESIYGEYILNEDLDGILIDTVVQIDNDLGNMQTRVIVTEEETVQIDSIKLIRVD